MRVIMDPDLGRFQVVWAAAGTATAVFPVAPGTLRMLANANVAPICEERDRVAHDSAFTSAPHPHAGA
jgi:prolyl-tRNA editing enzyme YbaK/EbsC (Cys-tRNA(Pro) deacylase)